MSAYDIHESRLRPGDGCIDGEADGTGRWLRRDDLGDRSVATIASAMPSRLCESIAARPSWITAPSMHPSPGRKRLSWMSYADIVHDVNEQVYDIDPQV